MTDSKSAPADRSPPTPLSLRVNFLCALVGNVLFLGMLFLVYILLGRFLGGDVAIGQYALAGSIVVPLIECLGMQLRTVYLSDVDRRHPFGSYLALRMATLPLVLLGSIAGLGILRGEFSLLPIVLLVAAFRGLESIADMLFGLFQTHYRMDRIAWSRLLLLGAFGVAAAVLVACRAGLPLLLCGMIAAESIALLVYAIPRARRMASIRPIWNAGHLKRIFLTALPLGGSLLLISIGAYIPRYLIVWIWRGRDEAFVMALLGRFSASAQLLILQSLFLTALGQAVAPRLAEVFHHSGPRFPRLFAKVFSVYAIISLAAAAVLYFFGPELLWLLFHVRFDGADRLMHWLALCALVQAADHCIGVTVTAARIFRSQFWIQIFKTAVLVGCGLWLLPRMGLSGGVVALIVGHGLGAVCLGVLLGYVYLQKGGRK